MNQVILRQEISSGKEILDELHQVYSWIPGSSNIRPVADQIAHKVEFLAEIKSNWDSIDDFILFKIFGYEFDVNNSTNKFRTKITHSSVPLNLKKLVKNQYPYKNLRCEHFIMWYSTKDKPYDGEHIARDVEEELRKILSPNFHRSFQFVFYENPKMTIPEFYHVQVFWVPYFSHS